MFRCDDLQADAHEPGDERFESLMEKISEIQQHFGPWIEAQAAGSNEALIEYTVSALIWIGSSFGFLREMDMISKKEELMDAMLLNLKAGVRMGERRTRDIVKQVEAEMMGKGETRQ